jgi:hypothetical protein
MPPPVMVSHWLLPGPRVSSVKMTPKEAAAAGAIGIIPNTTSPREVTDERSPMQARAPRGAIVASARS